MKSLPLTEWNSSELKNEINNQVHMLEDGHYLYEHERISLGTYCIIEAACNHNISKIIKELDRRTKV